MCSVACANVLLKTMWYRTVSFADFVWTAPTCCVQLRITAGKATCMHLTQPPWSWPLELDDIRANISLTVSVLWKKMQAKNLVILWHLKMEILKLMATAVRNFFVSKRNPNYQSHIQKFVESKKKPCPDVMRCHARALGICERGGFTALKILPFRIVEKNGVRQLRTHRRLWTVACWVELWHLPNVCYSQMVLRVTKVRWRSWKWRFSTVRPCMRRSSGRWRHVPKQGILRLLEPCA